MTSQRSAVEVLEAAAASASAACNAAQQTLLLCTEILESSNDYNNETIYAAHETIYAAFWAAYAAANATDTAYREALRCD